jgi:CO/xanthine dehydrogenase FAD-binding subunit
MTDATAVFSNTHLLVPEFEYLEPASLREACALLAEHGGQARLLAGGTDLLVQMKLERVAARYLVGLRRVPVLRDIVADGGVTIGAMVSIRGVSRSPAIRAGYLALHEACDSFSTVQVMVMGTIGGNVCNASPAADTAPALLAFDAEARIVGPDGERLVPIDEFFVGPGRTVLGRGELLGALRLPRTPAGAGSAFLKIGRVEADIAKVAVAVRIDRDDDRVAECRIALGAVAPTPIRSRQAERLLRGQRLSRALVADAARAAAAEIRPITDARSTAEYRRHAARVLVEDALATAWSRAGGKEVA